MPWLQRVEVSVLTVFQNSQYFEYATGSQYTKISNVLGILLCQSFTGYIDKVPNVPWILSEYVLETVLK